MTSKDFQLIANTLCYLKDKGTLDQHTALLVSAEFADQLKAVNPGFKRDKFLAVALGYNKKKE